MKKIVYLFIVLSINVYSQGSVITYKELYNPIKSNVKNWNIIKGIKVGWGTIDMRYKKEKVPNVDFNQKMIFISGWKGERVNCQLVICNNFYYPTTISYKINDFTNEKNTISAKNSFSGFVRYVMTDELNKDKKGACGSRNKKDFDATLVADPIDHHLKVVKLKKMQTQAIWIGINIPAKTVAGKYKGKVEIFNKGKKIDELIVDLKVINEKLPPVKDWKFHLDLWQNPYAVARIYGVLPWSDKHLEYLKKEMKHYVNAGGKVITTSLIHKPWNGQTYDYYDSMIKWIKKIDGTWKYDFSIFDKWVNLMLDLGVTKQINCYSMIPWNERFRYFDEKEKKYKYIVANPSSSAYKKHWTPFLKVFSEHLKDKGWFDKTHIAMDERPISKMLSTIEVIKNAVPNFKISFAGNLHPEIMDKIDDYCSTLSMKYTPLQVKKRKEENRVTTYYTSCSEPYPNSFTFSNVADCEWFGWYSGKENLDGYLRWALNSWTENPLQDSRFRTWGAGDTYFIYPGERTSIRFERLRDGIEMFEKIKILENRFQKERKKTNIYKLKNILSQFDERKLVKIPSHNVINKAKKEFDDLVEK